MENIYLTKGTDLTSVADAIREKAKLSDGLGFPDGFIEAINGIKTINILASGKIIPSENTKDYQLDTGVALNKKNFLLWHDGEVPAGSYAICFGYGQSPTSYYHIGRNGLGNKEPHSASVEIYNSTIVQLSGSYANYSYCLVANETYYWIVYDSSFTGF